MVRYGHLVFVIMDETDKIPFTFGVPYMQRKAFTLVELLVVIAIIGLLMSLLLPAVQQVRESARDAQCCNNLKQLATGTISFEGVHRHIPGGGWAWNWIGEPHCGGGWAQPGGQFYNILPFIEQNALHQLTDDTKAALAANTQELMGAALPIFNCPSRRKAKQYVYTQGHAFHVGRNTTSVNISAVARGDYAGNGGSVALNGFQPASYAKKSKGAIDKNLANFNGVFGPGSQLVAEEISDGTSTTLMYAEKYLDPRGYQVSTEENAVTADNESVYIGYDRDNVRFGRNDNHNYHPRRDRWGLDIDLCFGGPHADCFNVVFCDTSLHLISYNVSTQIFEYLCNRQDGQMVKPNDF